jgi:hypothetical protein
MPIGQSLQEVRYSLYHRAQRRIKIMESGNMLQEDELSLHDYKVSVLRKKTSSSPERASKQLEAIPSPPLSNNQ